MTKEFLVAHDYGMGGAWGIATAKTEQDVREVFPDLQIHHERPEWMTLDMFDELKEKSCFVVGDEATYPTWIRSLIDERP